ncbi:ADP-ribosylglycohydrolase family protein [Herbiconiux sp. P17]|uniref:ADP-ribosylglycohydrolase family protein n=1 Tax=Herbiconiux wuyangfengii TaxID=3342794 RepID=UPI0035B9F766
MSGAVALGAPSTSLVALDASYASRVYAGVLGKFIGVYLGRPVEGWPYERIQAEFGLVDEYVNESLGIPLIVADDDISGTLAFARVVEDAGDRAGSVSAADVGDTWLNYIIEDRTILWWGGYGRSTEHTAFLNLRNGIPAPASGSIAQNGRTLAEQIGAQIFSDAFGLMHPGDPAAAVALTRAAASASHDGVALDASAFFAAMRAAAFVERDLDELTAIGRSFVGDERLLGIVDDVTAQVGADDDWREVRGWVDAHYGYARYPGPCHALSNTAMALAALRLGGDDFRRSVAIAASVGFDTDSNAGTVGCLNGVRLGIAAIAAAPSLREPVADRAIVVSADGGEAVTDASRETARIVASARLLRGAPSADRAASPDEAAPPAVAAAAPTGPRFDFALPGAVHGFSLCPHASEAAGLHFGRSSAQPTPNTASVGLSSSRNDVDHLDVRPWARNLNAADGPAGLTVHVPAEVAVAVSTPTFLDPLDAISNFSTLASPALYPSDTVRLRLSASSPVEVVVYALYDDGHDGGGSVHREQSPPTLVETWPSELEWEVPEHGNVVPFRLGLAVTAPVADLDLVVHDVGWSGAPAAFRQRGILLADIWDTKPAGLAPWVSSARNWEADFGSTFCVSHPGELGVVTIGTRAWTDYSAASVLTLSLHDTAGLVVRARGHRRFSAALFTGGTVQLVDQTDAHRVVLAETPFPYDLDRRYHVELSCLGDELVLAVDGHEILRARTARAGGGGAGFLVERGTFTADGFTVIRRHGVHSVQNQRKATA